MVVLRYHVIQRSNPDLPHTEHVLIPFHYPLPTFFVFFLGGGMVNEVVDHTCGVQGLAVLALCSRETPDGALGTMLGI